MSAIGMPISQQADAFRIIGATKSREGSRANTGPTVVASSPVPSHALEITPVRTQRLSSMSCRRARSRPWYSRSLESGVREATMRDRSGSVSIVDRKAFTSLGSGFQSTYSGGSNAGNRFTARRQRSRKLFLEFSEEPAATRGGRFGRIPRQGFPKLDRGPKPVVRIGLQRLDERLFDDLRDIGPQRAHRLRLAAEPRDHHLLRVASLERQLPGEHLEGHDAEGVDVAARIERLDANLLGTHELGRAENDPGRGQLGDRGIGAALFREPEVHDHRALRPVAVV